METASGYLTGDLLVAMPGMPDPRFNKTVIYLCAHSEEGAMGLILNQMYDAMDFAELLAQVGLDSTLIVRDLPVRLGGPVEGSRGFVLHSTDYLPKDSMKVDVDFALSASVDILRDIAVGSGPDDCLLALGYAGWAAGQLETEIQENGWLTVPADKTLVFEREIETMWERSLAKIGVDASTLSSSAGRA